MRILYVAPVPPTPSNNGARQRTKHLLHALRKVGEVDFILHTNAPLSPSYCEQLRAEHNVADFFLTPDPAGTLFWAVEPLFPRRTYIWAREYASRASYYAENLNVKDQLAARIARVGYDAIVVRYLRCATRSGLLSAPSLCIDIDDIDYDYFHAPGAGLKSRIIGAWHTNQLERLMPRWTSKASVTWVSNPDDTKRITSLSSECLPNIVDAGTPPRDEPLNVGGMRMLFIGSLQWQPNQDGLLWFVRNVLPAIRTRLPGASLKVVGSEPPPHLAKELMASPGLEYVGPVTDLTSQYENAIFTIIPTFSGGGTHIKIPESYYHGLPCVTTPYGHRGYQSTFTHGHTISVARSVNEWVLQCIDLIKNPEKRTAMAARGIEVTKRYFTMHSFSARIADSLENLQMRKNASPCPPEYEKD